MNFQPNKLYHIYNQGNNRQLLFYNPENYLYFLRSVRRYVLPYCDVLAYCLMPNHYHFLINTDQHSIVEREIGSLKLTALSNGFRLLQSTHAQAINIQQKQTGSLFRQKAKAKCLECNDSNYPLTAFHYIHQNPIRAGLVKKIEEWKFSSFNDYAQLRNGSICNKTLAQKLIGFEKLDFCLESCKIISNEFSKNIY